MPGYNLPPGTTVRDCEGPEMPKCVRCGEEVNTVNDIGLCEDCAENEEGGELQRDKERLDWLEAGYNLIKVIQREAWKQGMTDAAEIVNDMRGEGESDLRCVFCEEPLTRPGGKKWWIGGATHGKGLCYDCIMSGMHTIMAGVQYAQEHGEGMNENPKE